MHFVIQGRAINLSNISSDRKKCYMDGKVDLRLVFTGSFFLEAERVVAATLYNSGEFLRA